MRIMYYLNPTTSRLSLLLHESEVKRTNVNNNDNLRVQWDLSYFCPMLLMCTTTIFLQTTVFVRIFLLICSDDDNECIGDDD